MFNGWSRSTLCALVAFAHLASAAQVISTSSSLIWFHGRWDTLPSSWWPGSGFKLAFSTAPTSLSLTVGATASSPPIPISYRFGATGTWNGFNLTAGANSLPIVLPSKLTFPLTFDVVTELETGQGRLELQGITLDDNAKLTAYSPAKVAFEFIGDSLTAGYLCPRGVVDNWSFKTADYFQAEHNQIAQSGICMTNMLCYGNPNGMVVQYFDTQNSAYTYINNNVTTKWDFSKYKVTPTHFVIALGTNDLSNNVPSATYVSTYLTFLKDLRAQFKTQPFFVMSPWGWPYAGGVTPYLQPETAQIVSGSNDANVHLINGTNWIQDGDTYDGTHPIPAAHDKIAAKMIAALETFGLTAPAGAVLPSEPGSTTSLPTTTTTKPATTTTAPPTTTSSPSGGATVAHWGQCGGMGWTGGTVCQSGTTCTVVNPYYSQCL